jgi:hypothetical protein
LGKYSKILSLLPEGESKRKFNVCKNGKINYNLNFKIIYMRTRKNPNINQLIKVLAWNKCRVYIRKRSKNVSVQNTVPCSGGSAGKTVGILKITDRRRHLNSITLPPLFPVQAHRYLLERNLKSASRRNIPPMRSTAVPQL